MLLAPNPIVLTLLQKWERGPASCQHCRSPCLCLMAHSLGTFFAENLLIQKKSSSLQFQAFLLDLASEVRNDEFSRLAKSRWQDCRKEPDDDEYNVCNVCRSLGLAFVIITGTT